MIYRCTRIDAAAVAPHGGAWIEMGLSRPVITVSPVAPHGGAWIEIECRVFCAKYAKVAPHGGAWIEISNLSGYSNQPKPSPLTEGRGLKCRRRMKNAVLTASPLTEGRGLKLDGFPQARQSACRPSRRGVD